MLAKSISGIYQSANALGDRVGNSASLRIVCISIVNPHLSRHDDSIDLCSKGNGYA